MLLTLAQLVFRCLIYSILAFIRCSSSTCCLKVMFFHFSHTVYMFHRNITSVAWWNWPNIKKTFKFAWLETSNACKRQTSVTDVSACFMAISIIFRSPSVLWNQTSFDLLKKSFALSREWMTDIIKGLNRLTFFVQPLYILRGKGQFSPLKYSDSWSENKRNNCCEKTWSAFVT